MLSVYRHCSYHFYIISNVDVIIAITITLVATIIIINYHITNISNIIIIISWRGGGAPLQAHYSQLRWQSPWHRQPQQAELRRSVCPHALLS